jgi:DNA polymerase/3'-5' exonuclease PolX
MDNFKGKLLSQLQLLSKLEDNKFKSRAYSNAVTTLSNVPELDLLEFTSFTYLPGIGKGISDKIIEFRNTGKISKLDVLMAEHSDRLSNLEYKVRKGYISKRIPWIEANKIAKDLGLVETDDLKLVGSYRRKSNLIADLDLLALTEDAYSKTIDKLASNPNLEVLVSGSEKTSFKYNNPENTQIDINNGSHGNRWTQLLHHTGSKDSNIRLRSIAKRLGYTLNQYGLFGYPGEIHSEEDIFKALNTPYVPPENR